CPQNSESSRHQLPHANARPPMIATGKIPSVRSNTPPWPGIRLELSLAPALRLSQLSRKSPACAQTAKTPPASAATTMLFAVRTGTPFCKVENAVPIVPVASIIHTADAATPPNSPAHVLDGLIRGAMRGPPTALPVK